MSRFTREQLDQILRNPAIRDVTLVAPRLPNPLPESDAGEKPLGEVQDEKGCAGRFIVRIERRGTKLLDVDNLYGSVKYLCDGLRYAKIIPEDDPLSIELIVTQKKVKRGFTGTLVEVKPREG